MRPPKADRLYEVKAFLLSCPQLERPPGTICRQEKDMTVSPTLFILLFSVNIDLGHLHLTTKGPGKVEPLDVEQSRQQRSLDVECQKGNPLGASYSGKKNHTVSGRICQSWAASEPHSPKYTDVGKVGETEAGNHNHCRNPNKDIGGVWCYTLDPEKRREFCSVPICPPSMLKVLDFSADSNAEYAGATLEAGPLTESFTICSAFMVEAWKGVTSSAKLFEMVQSSGQAWAYVTLFSSTVSQYTVKLGPLKIVKETNSIFFPLRWTRVCLSLDSVVGKLMLVVDGQLLVVEEHKREEEVKRRPANISLVLKHEVTGRVAELNIFNSSFSVESMIAQTTAGGEECGAPGDLVNWEEAEWTLHIFFVFFCLKSWCSVSIL